MNNHSTVWAPDLTPKSRNFPSWHQAEVVTLPKFESDDESFNRMLAQERKRSERSKRPFMLMLMSFDGVPAGLNGNDPRKKVYSCLSSCKRDTDFLGWYRSGSVIGVIFTDICMSDNGAAFELITQRIRSRLASVLEPGDIGKIDIAFHVYPGKPGSDVLSSHLTICPDETRINYSQKRSPFFDRFIDMAGMLNLL